MLHTPFLPASQFCRANRVVKESAKVLPVEITARLRKVASMGFFSKILGAGIGVDDSTMYASGVIPALGASGSSFAMEIPVRVSRTKAENMIDFMIASPVIGIACEPPARFALAIDLLRSVMNRDYVGTCTPAI